MAPQARGRRCVRAPAAYIEDCIERQLHACMHALPCGAWLAALLRRALPQNSFWGSPERSLAQLSLAELG